MDSVCTAVEADWSGQQHQRSGQSLRESVHAALGLLIKQRRVYYTGSGGYFLTTPADASSASSAASASTTALKAMSGQLNRLRSSLRGSNNSGSGGGSISSPAASKRPSTDVSLNGTAQTSVSRPLLILLNLL